MSQENVDVVRSHLEAWIRRDKAAYVASFRSDAEIDWSRARAPYSGVYRGREQQKAFWDVFWSTFEDSQLETHDLTEVGSEVVVWNTAHMWGRDGIEVTARSALVFTVENGEITRLRLFQERAEALKAAGPSEQAMSQENVEVARRACEAAWRRPTPDYETLNELARPDHEMFTVQSLVEGGGYRGAPGFREWLTSWREMFGEDWNSSVEETKAVDSERVLVTGWIKARGSRGGVPIEQRFWVVMVVRDGKLARSTVYTDESQALEAAGLSK
jgi:ketosteroid isomerase-like protein